MVLSGFNLMEKGVMHWFPLNNAQVLVNLIAEFRFEFETWMSCVMDKVRNFIL